ncbi:hypothetical protein ACHAXT_005272 [Thalassiosira profunda]
MTREESEELASLKLAGSVKGGQTIADACQRWQKHLQGCLAGEELSEKELRVATAVLDALARGRETTGAAEAAVRSNDASSTQVSIVQRIREGAATGRETVGAAEAAVRVDDASGTQVSIVQRRREGGDRGRDAQAAAGTWDVKWDAKYDLLVQFKTEHGHLHVPESYDASLSSWIKIQRQKRKGTARNNRITDRQIRRLDELGFQWEQEMTWEDVQACERTTRIEAVVRRHCNDNKDEMRVFFAGTTAGTILADFHDELGEYLRSDVQDSLKTIRRRLASNK